MLGKKNLSSQNSLCLRCSCFPCQMLLYLEPGWQNVLACWSPRWAAGSQRGFCLSVMWWSGAAKVYSAILVCAAESCFFGVIDSVADAWMHVMWTSKPQSTAGSWNKILQHVYLEHMGSNRSWSLDSWNPCFFLTVEKMSILLNQETLDSWFFFWKLEPFSLHCAHFLCFAITYEKYPWLLFNLLRKLLKNPTEAGKFTINTKAAWFTALPTQCTSWSALASDIQEND